MNHNNATVESFQKLEKALMNPCESCMDNHTIMTLCKHVLYNYVYKIFELDGVLVYRNQILDDTGCFVLTPAFIHDVFNYTWPKLLNSTHWEFEYIMSLIYHVDHGKYVLSNDDMNDCKDCLYQLIKRLIHGHPNISMMDNPNVTMNVLDCALKHFEKQICIDDGSYMKNHDYDIVSMAFMLALEYVPLKDVCELVQNELKNALNVFDKMIHDGSALKTQQRRVALLLIILDTLIFITCLTCRNPVINVNSYTCPPLTELNLSTCKPSDMIDSLFIQFIQIVNQLYIYTLSNTNDIVNWMRGLDDTMQIGIVLLNDTFNHYSGVFMQTPDKQSNNYSRVTDILVCALNKHEQCRMAQMACT